MSLMGSVRLRNWSLLSSDRVTNRLMSWRASTLSQVAGAMMIKSVVYAFPNHLVSCVLLPPKICEVFKLLSTPFLWPHDIDEEKVTWCLWSRLCQSKASGRMGFRLAIV